MQRGQQVAGALRDPCLLLKSTGMAASSSPCRRSAHRDLPGRVQVAGRSTWAITQQQWIILTGVPSIVARSVRFRLLRPGVLRARASGSTRWLIRAVAADDPRGGALERGDAQDRAQRTRRAGLVHAFGVPKWLTILKIVIPTSIAGITTGVALAIARVIGETAPCSSLSSSPRA